MPVINCVPRFVILQSEIMFQFGIMPKFTGP
jgi:hypothetical protein